MTVDPVPDPRAAPVYCLTMDVDWASEYAIAATLADIRGRSIRPTVFATHPSQELARAAAAGEIELAIHPNFLPGSTQGESPEDVIDYVFKLVPGAISFRSHCYMENTNIMRLLAQRGIKFDSNFCSFLEPHLLPIRHFTGIWRFPVFWEDDVHWMLGAPWDAGAFRTAFFSPGLKIFNIHPHYYSLNCPSAMFHAKAKPYTRIMDEEQAETLRHTGPGSATFLNDVLDGLVIGHSFHTLGELFDGLCPSEPVGMEGQWRR